MAHHHSEPVLVEREVNIGALEATRVKRERLSVGARGIGYAVIMLAALCACDNGKDGKDGKDKDVKEPLSECATYAASVELCFGARVSKQLRASFLKPLSGEAGLAELRTQCVERNATLRRSCR